jgi:hypothetical protein
MATSSKLTKLSEKHTITDVEVIVSQTHIHSTLENPAKGSGVCVVP